jgi:hypothetical protein
VLDPRAAPFAGFVHAIAPFPDNTFQSLLSDSRQHLLGTPGETGAAVAPTRSSAVIRSAAVWDHLQQRVTVTGDTESQRWRIRALLLRWCRGFLTGRRHDSLKSQVSHHVSVVLIRVSRI